MLFAGINGFIDAIPVERVKIWQNAMLRYMETSYPEVGKDIAERKQITKDTEARLREALQNFNATFH